MEAIASSVFIPPVPETYHLLNNSTSSFKTPNKRIGSLRIAESSHLFRVRAHVLPSEASGSGEGEDVNPSNNAFGAAFEDVVSFPQVIPEQLNFGRILLLQMTASQHYVLLSIIYSS